MLKAKIQCLINWKTGGRGRVLAVWRVVVLPKLDPNLVELWDVCDHLDKFSQEFSPAEDLEDDVSDDGMASGSYHRQVITAPRRG